MTTKRVTITITVTAAHLPLLRQLWTAGAVFSPGAVKALQRLPEAPAGVAPAGVAPGPEAPVQVAPGVIPNLRGVPASVDPSTGGTPGQ